MTPVREAVVLPAIFLTVALLGGLRVADAVRLLPPSLTALVLAVVLLGALVRGGVLVPPALMHGGRTAAENVSGAVVLLTAFAASAQAINLLLPERGLLHGAFAIFLFTQIMTMHAAGAGRAGQLRSMAVLLGSLFVLRYVVIEALYAPDGGTLHRVLTTLMSGATLGGIAYDPNAPLTGYVGFLTLMLYVIGLVLLPGTPAASALVVRPRDTTALRSTLPVVLCLCLFGCHPGPAGNEPAAGAPPAGSPTPAADKRDDLVTPEQRNAALRHAQVWRKPAAPTRSVDLSKNPAGPGAFDESGSLECRLVLKAMSGTTPKFDCEMAGGDVVRVKYGRGNPELYAEVAATRLVAALGFGADRVYVVRQVECAGCGADPFPALRCLADGTREACFPHGVDYADTATFRDAVVERKLEGRRIESVPDQGWAWYELDAIEPASGGAPRAHTDALKLLAVFLAHWDNKAENQRLLCLPGGDLRDGGCSRPFAIMQDLGASFGPVKLDLQNWRSLPVWADARTCRVSMEHLPWGGGTFPEQRIIEEGRLFLLALLEQISAPQIEGLFAGSRVGDSDGVSADGRRPSAWAAAFEDRVRQIREAGPCPRETDPRITGAS